MSEMQIEVLRVYWDDEEGRLSVRLTPDSSKMTLSALAGGFETIFYNGERASVPAVCDTGSAEGPQQDPTEGGDCDAPAPVIGAPHIAGESTAGTSAKINDEGAEEPEATVPSEAPPPPSRGARKNLFSGL